MQTRKKRENSQHRLVEQRPYVSLVMPRLDQLRPAPERHVAHEVIPVPPHPFTSLPRTSHTKIFKDAREVVEPIPDDEHLAHTALKALDELARAARYEVLVFLDRGGAHTAPPVLAPPQVRVRVEDPDHGQRLVGEHAPDEVCDAGSAGWKRRKEKGSRRGVEGGR